MANISYNKIIKYVVKAVCDGPLHIGSATGGKEEVLIHPISGVPFVQASSIAGAFRGYYAGKHTIDEVNDLFGASSVKENSNAYDYRSRVKFTDGIFTANTLKMELRPNVKIDRESGSVSSSKGSGQKFDVEYVGKGSEFETFIYLYTDENSIHEEAINELLAELAAGNICLGAKKSSGAGNLTVKRILKKSFDMRISNERKLWAEEDVMAEDLYENVTCSLPVKKSENTGYSVVVTGAIETALLVKGIATSSFGKDAPDSENIKNSQGEYIVPGTSIRGAMRSQLEKIAEYISKPSVIDASFGMVGKDNDEGYAGNLRFKDIIIDNKKSDDKMLRHRIHIDKFTGGVFSGGLFSESNVTGNVEINIDIEDKNNADATLGLLLLGLRDLAAKSMNLGGGYATGKGFIDVSSIKIIRGDKSAEISYSGNSSITDNDGIISNAMKALKEVG